MNTSANKITVDITGPSPDTPWVDCPLQSGDYGICVAHDFLHPQTAPNQRGLRCPESRALDRAGQYSYRIPDACPLRKGPVVVEGT